MQFIQGYRGQERRFTYTNGEAVVINMSFAMIPCQVAIAFKDYMAHVDQKPDNYFDGYVDYLQKLPQNSTKTREQIKKAIFDVKSNNPFLLSLQSNLTDLRRERVALAVASSGNYGLSFPTYPGQLSSVVSVGGVQWPLLQGNTTMGATNNPPNPTRNKPLDNPWTDAGAIYSGFGWYTLPRHILEGYCDNDNCITSNSDIADVKFDNFGYQGTSFAGPSVATYFAIRGEGHNPCYPNSGKGFNFTKVVSSSSITFKALTDYHAVLFKGGAGGVLYIGLSSTPARERC